MRYLNLDIDLLNSDRFQDATERQQAAWINLLRYCAIQENGGVVLECEDWNNLKWINKTSVPLFIINAYSPLWEWKYGNLCIWGYPVQQEHKLKQSRKAGSIGGATFSARKAESAAVNGSKGGRPRKENNPSGNPSG